MASSFSFTNTTAASNSVTPVDIKVVTNYAKIADEPTEAVLQNKTASLDQGEQLTYRCQKVNRVSTSQSIQHPSVVRDGVQYVVKLEEILRTTDSDGNIIQDEPIVAYLTIRHQLTANVSDSIIDTVVKRLLGACYHSNGTSRWGDLMRSALIPVSD